MLLRRASDTKTNPLALFKRCHFDALTHYPQSLCRLIDMVGSDPIAIGTVLPFDIGEARPIEQLNAVPRLNDKEREDIARRTARRLPGDSA